MQPFEFADGSPDTFVARACDALRQLELDDIVSLRHEAGELTVVFSRLGTSVLKFAIAPVAGGGFRTELKSSQVSPLHAAFRQGFEEKFAEVVTRAGATLV
jgi:hypothetical protein